MNRTTVYISVQIIDFLVPSFYPYFCFPNWSKYPFLCYPLVAYLKYHVSLLFNTLLIIVFKQKYTINYAIKIINQVYFVLFTLFTYYMIFFCLESDVACIRGSILACAALVSAARGLRMKPDILNDVCTLIKCDSHDVESIVARIEVILAECAVHQTYSDSNSLCL